MQNHLGAFGFSGDEVFEALEIERCDPAGVLGVERKGHGEGRIAHRGKPADRGSEQCARQPAGGHHPEDGKEQTGQSNCSRGRPKAGTRIRRSCMCI